MFSPIEKKMANCPKCQKPILNEGIFTASVRFNMRCAWCQSTLEINVQPKIVTEVIKLANGDSVREIYENGHKIHYETQKTVPIPTKASGQLPLSNGELDVKDINQRGFRIVGYFYPEEPSQL